VVEEWGWLEVNAFLSVFAELCKVMMGNAAGCVHVLGRILLRGEGLSCWGGGVDCWGL
jgi:hypothetical protein